MADSCLDQMRVARVIQERSTSKFQGHPMTREQVERQVLDYLRTMFGACRDGNYLGFGVRVCLENSQLSHRVRCGRSPLDSWSPLSAAGSGVNDKVA